MISRIQACFRVANIALYFYRCFALHFIENIKIIVDARFLSEMWTQSKKTKIFNNLAAWDQATDPFPITPETIQQ